MSEFSSGAESGLEDEPRRPNLNQIIRDLDEFEPPGLDSYWLEYDFTGEAKWPENYFGYPNPFDTVSQQYLDALKRGEERPMTVERMAVDAHNYEKARREAGEEQPFPSFEEMYGYPDPRQADPPEPRATTGP